MIDQETLKEFDNLYNETYESILKYVVCNCENAEDVKDIVQNIYIELLKKIQNKVNFKNAKAYVFGIAKNKVNEYYRFKYKSKIISLFSKKEELELIDNIPSDFDTQENFIQKEDIDFVWNFLKKKKVIIFKIFYLYYYLGLSINEISTELNVSVSNVKHYLYRSLNELKNLMKNRSDENV